MQHEHISRQEKSKLACYDPMYDQIYDAAYGTMFTFYDDEEGNDSEIDNNWLLSKSILLFANGYH